MTSIQDPLLVCPCLPRGFLIPSNECASYASAENRENAFDDTQPWRHSVALKAYMWNRSIFSNLGTPCPQHFL